MLEELPTVVYVEQQYPLHCWPFVLGINSLLVTGSEGDWDSSQEMGSQRGLEKGKAQKQSVKKYLLFSCCYKSIIRVLLYITLVYLQHGNLSLVFLSYIF